MIYHFPYYHTKVWNETHWDVEDHPRASFEHLTDYQENITGAVIIDKDEQGIHILFIPNNVAKDNLLLPNYYETEISNNFLIKSSYNNPEYGIIGIVEDWRIEYEDHPGGSNCSYSLRNYSATEPWFLVGIPPDVHTVDDYLVYEIKDSVGITDTKDLIKIDQRFRPYLLLVIDESTDKADIISQDIYSSEPINGSFYYNFPAWRVLGEDVNKVVPDEFIGVPGYGASSDIIRDEIITAPFSITIPTNNENFELIFRKNDWSHFVPDFRNLSIVLNDPEYTFDLNVKEPIEIDKGFVLSFNFYFPKNQQVSKKELFLTTKIKGKDFNVYLVPKNSFSSVTDAWKDFHSNTRIHSSVLQNYFFALEYDEKIILYDSTLVTNSWYKVNIILRKNNVELEVGNIKIKQVLLDEEQDKINLDEILGPFSLINGFSCLLKSLQLYEYSEEIIEPFNYFVDYKMVDFYQIRSCNFECQWALPEWSEELKQNIYVPKKKLDIRSGESDFCPFAAYGYDPFRQVSNATECIHTTLIPVNINYPEMFTEDIVQAPHYKISISLNTEPFSNDAIVNEYQCRMLYDIYEKWRPISRVSHYELGINFVTDFSRTGHSLYKNATLGGNWISRCTVFKDIAENAYIFNSLEDGFDEKMHRWIINHELDTTEIIAQSFDENNRLMYPATQRALDKSTYIIDFSPNKAGGYALIQQAKNVTLIDQALNNPFYIYTERVGENAVLLQLQDSERFREEILNFAALSSSIKADLLDTFEDGKALVNENDKMFWVRNKSKVWNIKHDLDMMGVMVQVYDINWKAVKPSNVILVNKDVLQITFDTPMNGTVGLRKIGNPEWKNAAVQEIMDGGYFLLGDLNGNNIINWSYGTNFSSIKDSSLKKMQSASTIKVPVSDWFETQEEYTFIGKYPAYMGNDLNIREIGLFNNKDEMCFYSLGHLLYVVRDFEFVVTYTIKKHDIL